METKEVSHGMSDMTTAVGSVCMNGISMATFIIMGVWMVNKMLEIAFGFALIPAR